MNVYDMTNKLIKYSNYSDIIEQQCNI